LNPLSPLSARKAFESGGSSRFGAEIYEGLLTETPLKIIKLIRIGKQLEKLSDFFGINSKSNLKIILKTLYKKLTKPFREKDLR
jgi:hypothetical protein